MNELHCFRGNHFNHIMGKTVFTLLDQRANREIISMNIPNIPTNYAGCLSTGITQQG